MNPYRIAWLRLVIAVAQQEAWTLRRWALADYARKQRSFWELKVVDSAIDMSGVDVKR